jgi:hypothetical protein
MDALFNYPYLRGIQELRLYLNSGEDDKGQQRYVYKLDPAALPAHTLRVLDVARCWIELPWSGATVLPHWINNLPRSGDDTVLHRLSVMRLYRCSSPLKDLEGFISTAPSLRSLHIESHQFASYRDDVGKHFAIRSPSVATVKLAGLEFRTIEGVQLETPCLCTFKYDGCIRFLNDIGSDQAETS